MSERFLNSDACLIRGLRQDDKNAFELVFHRFKDKLFYFTLGYLHSSDESEEVVQHIFVSLWENRSSLKEEGSLKSFLYKATSNQISNILKHKVVEQKYAEHVKITEDYIEDDDTRENILYKDLQFAIDNLIGELPHKQQEIFKLSRNEGLSHSEIANRMGLSVRSVESHIYRVLKHIRERLKKEHLLTE